MTTSYSDIHLTYSFCILLHTRTRGLPQPPWNRQGWDDMFYSSQRPIVWPLRWCNISILARRRTVWVPLHQETRLLTFWTPLASPHDASRVSASYITGERETMALPLIAFMLRRLTDIMSTLSARSRTAARPRTLNIHILCLWKKPGMRQLVKKDCKMTASCFSSSMHLVKRIM